MRTLLPRVLFFVLILVGSTAWPVAAAAQDLLSRTKADDPRCPGHRWVGVKKSRFAACPSAAGWQGQPLFREFFESAACAARDNAWRVGLDRFCVYEAPGGPEDPPAALRARLARLEKDCVALQSYGGETGESSGAGRWRALEDHFLAEAGGLATPQPGRARVRLALLDTQPSGSGAPAAPGVSLHGYSLAHFARRLACGPSFGSTSCGFELATRLAMPIRELANGPGGLPTPVAGDPVTEGGRFGRIADFATAVADEVARAGHGGPERVVLSLALGWDAGLFGGLEERREQMPPAVQAAFDALTLARKSGFLVLVAAGNRGPYAGSTCGQLLPAAWERSPVARAPGAGGALVYAVGGVQSEGEPLANARLCSMPSRVAFADHAVVTDGAGAATATLTGSSVAATVVAATAAAAWSHQPDLSPRALMAKIEAAGDRIHLPPALLAVPGVAAPLSRIAFCPGLAAVCREAGTCVNLDCRGWNPNPPGLPTTIAGGLQASASRVSREPLVPTCKQASCQAENRRTASLPNNPSAVPVRPQPEEDPCLNCTAGGRRMLTLVASLTSPLVGEPERCPLAIELKASWFKDHPQVQFLRAKLLEIQTTTAGGVELTSYTIEGAEFSPSQLGPVEVPLDFPCGELERSSARLVFSASPAASAASPIEGAVFVNP